MKRDRAAAARGPGRGPGWPWYPFVLFALVMAVAPGFLLGGLAAASGALDWGAGAWYPAAVQAHGHAQLVGFGGAMILGVALHFLPRLAGSPLARPRQVPWLFAAFAAGTLLRVTAQPAAAAAGSPPAALLWRAAAPAGGLLQILAVAGIVWALARAFHRGSRLKKGRAVAAVTPLLALAALSLLAALVAGTAGTAAWARDPAAHPVLDPVVDRVVVDTLLFGFIAAVSVAMSARLFPIHFRVRTSRTGGLFAAAALLALAWVTLLTWAVGRLAFDLQSPVPGVTALLQGVALLVGLWALRVFERRVPLPGDAGRYGILAEPAALGALTANIWAAAAGVNQVVLGLETLGVNLLPGSPARDLTLHAAGAGWMTLLILSVGGAMLPGFGGARPYRGGWLWTAVVLGNLAALSRILPALLRTVSGSTTPWASQVVALGGMLGVLTMICFWIALTRSWQAAGGRP